MERCSIKKNILRGLVLREFLNLIRSACSYNLCVSATLIGIRAVDKKSARRPKYPLVGTGYIELGLGSVCGRYQVKRSWKSVVIHKMSVILSLRGRM